MALGPLLTALWVGLYMPFLPFAVIALVTLAYYGGADNLWWWQCLLQLVLGYGFSALVYRAWLRQESWRVMLRMPIPSLDSALLIDVITCCIVVAIVATVYPMQRLHSAPLLLYGPPTAGALLLAWYGIAILAKWFWYGNGAKRALNQRMHTRWPLEKALCELTAWIIMVDLMYASSGVEARVLVAVVAGIRLLILATNTAHLWLIKSI